MRLTLVPRADRVERLFLLDVMADAIGDLAADFKPERFLAVTPEKLYPLVYVRLQPHAARLNLPASKMEPLAAAHRKNLFAELRRGAELRRIDAALTAAGIDYLLLKGPVLAATVYPERAARTMIDLDFLLANEELPRALEVLEQAGYRIPSLFIGTELAAGDAPPLIHDEPGGPSIELHTMLDSLPEERHALRAMLPSARRVDVGHGLTLPALERGEFFAHVVAHVSKHHRFEGELRSLLDVALLLRADEQALDWNALDAEWTRRGLRDWIVLTVALANILLGAPMPAIYRDRKPSPEALVIAAEQLWVAEKARVPTSITYGIARRVPTPVHAQVAPAMVALPRGMDGTRARAARQFDRARKLLAAIRRGALRPSVIASDLDLFLKRERLYAIVEKGARRGFGDPR
jgi:hypothetical protein